MRGSAGSFCYFSYAYCTWGRLHSLVHAPLQSDTGDCVSKYPGESAAAKAVTKDFWADHSHKTLSEVHRGLPEHHWHPADLLVSSIFLLSKELSDFPLLKTFILSLTDVIPTFKPEPCYSMGLPSSCSNTTRTVCVVRVPCPCVHLCQACRGISCSLPRHLESGLILGKY